MTSRKALPFFYLLVLTAFVPAVVLDAAWHGARAQIYTIGTQAADELKARLQAFVSPSEIPGAREALVSFYEGRGYGPIWVGEHGPTRAANLVINELARAGDYGLESKDFALKAAAAPRLGGSWSAAETAAADLEISTLVLKYANEARGGRISDPERLLSSYLDRQPDLPDPAAVLAAVAASTTPDAVLRGYQPQQRQFKLLQAAYLKLRGKGGSQPDYGLPARGRTLVRGVRDDDVVLLRKRFGLPTVGDDAKLYDEGVIEAVKAFQARAGLSADGIVGRRTREAMAPNSDEQKLQRIVANMEAWRWMPADLGEEYLFVNVPSFTISLLKHGDTVYSERVITGQRSKQTPIFSKELSTVVLRPQWHLPDSIKIEKLISAQRRGRTLEDLGYVIRKGRRVVKSWQVNWATANLRQYEISQPSGDGNALGDVKFLFPNKHSVYLHDTPSKSLFNASERDFSHGCIRLRNPLTLAQLLLDEDRGTGTFDVKRLVRRGPGSNQIQLDTPMPIHIGYFTAWADADGNVTFYKDVYGHERRIDLALAGKWNAIDRGRDHLATVNTSQLRGIGVLGSGNLDEDDLEKLPFPMGATSGSDSLFKPAKGYTYRRNGNSVGDMIQRALGVP
jgi:murein L,D-transpeptidase YcbB/YkuD